MLWLFLSSQPVFGFRTVGRTKQDIWRHHLELVTFFSIFWYIIGDTATFTKVNKTSWELSKQDKQIKAFSKTLEHFVSLTEHCSETITLPKLNKTIFHTDWAWFVLLFNLSSVLWGVCRGRWGMESAVRRVRGVLSLMLSCSEIQREEGIRDSPLSLQLCQ